MSVADIERLCRSAEEFYRIRNEQKFNADGSPRMHGGAPVYREIVIVRRPLRRVQSLIFNRLLRAVEFPPYIQAGVRGRSNVTNARLHLGYKHHFLLDVRNFFPSVSHRLVYEAFRQLSCTPDAARYLTRLTTFRGGLPQGTRTSPHLANVALQSLDEELYSWGEARGLVYSRYFDDLTFSANRDFKAQTPELLDMVTARGLRLAHKKVSYKQGTVIVTGVEVGRRRLRLPPQKRAELQTLDPSSSRAIGMRAYQAHIRATAG